MERRDFAWLFEQVVYCSKRVTHPDWPKGSYVYFVPGSVFEVNRAPLLGIIPEGTIVNYRNHIDICYGDGTYGVWNPTQADLFAQGYSFA